MIWSLLSFIAFYFLSALKLPFLFEVLFSFEVLMISRWLLGMGLIEMPVAAGFDGRLQSKGYC